MNTAVLTSLPGRYARALFEVSQEQQQTDNVLQWLIVVQEHITSALIALKPHEFKAFVETFQTPSYVAHFLCLLHEAKRYPVLKEIITIFKHLNDQAKGRLSATISVPVMPTLTQKQKIEDKITHIFGKEIHYQYESIPSLLGGFVATINNSLQLDASVSSQLNDMLTVLKEQEMPQKRYIS